MTAWTPRLVCFDLDGTIMLRPNSLQFLLALNRAPAAAMADIDRRESNGQLHWVAADYERAPFLAGLPVAAIEKHLDEELVTIANLAPVLATLKSREIVSVLITSGPAEVAEALGRRFAFDRCCGSEFETVGGVFTGRISAHLGSEGKVECLLGICTECGLTLGDCVAVGDGSSDLDLFDTVGLAVGVDCAGDVARHAQHVIIGHDLAPLLSLLLAGRSHLVP